MKQTGEDDESPGADPVPGAQSGRGRDADEPTDIPARGWRDIAVRVKNGIRDDHSSLAAAGVGFFGFLSLVPGLAALVSIYGLFASPDQVRERVDSLFGALPTEAKELLTDQLSRLTSSSGASLSIGLVVSLVLALWSASSGVQHLLEAINLAYNEEETRGFVKRRGLSLGITVGVLVIAAAAIAGIGAASSLGESNALLRWVINVGTWIVLAALFVSVLAVLYRFGPDRDDPKWRWATPGSIIGTVLWAVLTIGFQVYVSNFGSYNETYGSLAAVVIMLFWMYLSAFVVLVGAQLNSEMEHQTVKDTTVGQPRPMGSRDAEMADTLGESS